MYTYIHIYIYTYTYITEIEGGALWRQCDAVTFVIAIKMPPALRLLLLRNFQLINKCPITSINCDCNTTGF